MVALNRLARLFCASSLQSWEGITCIVGSSPSTRADFEPVVHWDPSLTLCSVASRFLRRLCQRFLVLPRTSIMGIRRCRRGSCPLLLLWWSTRSAAGRL